MLQSKSQNQLQLPLPLNHEPNARNWFVAETKPNKILQATAHLNEQEFHTFCPLIAEDTLVRLPRSAGKTQGKAIRTITRPLFTNYLFIQIDLEHQPWQKINFTPGIKRLLTGAANKTDENNDPIEQTPIPIKSNVIKHLLENPIFHVNPGPFIHQRVRLLTPILNGELGTITEISKYSIEVLLDSTHHTIRTSKSQVEARVLPGGNEALENQQ
jgi:transcription antitermination factor NusG